MSEADADVYLLSTTDEPQTLHTPDRATSEAIDVQKFTNLGHQIENFDRDVLGCLQIAQTANSGGPM